ncbi:MAG: sirohydrochlorin chelatase [Chloroflexi bacterium]|nr:sirohydrochlorin chelatase [Chloroflexota bacterium]
MTDQALLLMAHGSRNAEARAEYIRIRDALASRLPEERVVFSVLEFPDDAELPSIQEGWRRCLAAGAQQVVALPFFLFPAGHVREDLPTELQEARAHLRGAELDLLPPLGAADELLDVVADRAGEALASLPEVDGPAAVLLVGAGTSDPDANGDLCKAARLLWEREHQRFALVETAWVSLTEPTVQAGVERCLRLGARRIAVVPYFLNTGVLLRRIDTRLAEAQAAHPGLPLARSMHMGLHPRLLDLLERKAREGLDGGHGRDTVLAVCGRPSCGAVAEGRASLSHDATRTS